MHRSISLAVIGAGYWGSKLISEYLALSKKRKDAKITAVADKSFARLRHIAESFSLPVSMLKNDYHEILENPKITGVHIATPNESHYEIAMEAIGAGKHVLLEKPMCLSSSDAFRLARCAEKNNIVLLIGHIFRFNNAINMIKELIEKGKIKGIRCIELRWTSFMSPPSGREIVFDLAPHPVDILNHILEEWPRRVYVKAQSYERKRAGLEEVAFAILDLPEDIVASLTLSWMHHGSKHRTVTVVTKENMIEIEAVKQTIKLYENGQITEIPVQRNNTMESEINHFFNCIKNNDPPVNSALTGIMNVTVLEAMRKSLERGEMVSVIGR